jgi:hypothetical protein
MRVCIRTAFMLHHEGTRREHFRRFQHHMGCWALLILLMKSGTHWYDSSVSVMVSRTDMEGYHASPDAHRGSPTQNSACRWRRVPQGEPISMTR